MVRVGNRLDGQEADVLVSLDRRLKSREVPLSQRTLQKVADHVADILETLKTADAPRLARAPGLDQDRDDVILRSPRTCRLSSRQVEILGMVAEGTSNKVIAAQLHMSDQTIKNHMSNILDRLYANDRTHAVVLAYRLGLLDL